MTIRGICSFECDMFLLGLANDIVHRCDMYKSTKANDNEGIKCRANNSVGARVLERARERRA